MVGSGSSYTDELVAVWKLTSPSLFTYERMRFSAWDGIVVGGQTAASLTGVGDFHLSPFRLYAPKRFNTRNRLARFGKRIVAREDVVFQQGVPVTKMERTISDLVLGTGASSCRMTRLRLANLRARLSAVMGERDALAEQVKGLEASGE